MTIHYHTGFEGSTLLPDPTWLYAGSNPPTTQGVVAADPHTGANCLQLAFANSDNWGWQGDRQVRAAAATSITFGFAFKVSNLPSVDAFMAGVVCENASSAGVINVAVEEDGSVTLRRVTSDVTQTGGTVVAAAPSGTVTADAWHYVEMLMVFSDTVGTIKVWLDGAILFDVAASDTNSGISTILTGFYPRLSFSTGAIGTGPTIRIDDVIVASGLAAALGPQAHEALTATSSVESDGVGSDGNSVDNYLLVAAYNADYVDVVSGDRERYGLADRTHTGTINAVTVRGVVDKPAVGVIVANGFLLSNATEVNGSALMIGGGPGTKVLAGPLETDPDTAAAWGDAGLNAVTVGVEAA